MGIFEIVKLYGKFKDVRAVVTEEKGQAGWWYSRKVVGAALVFGAAVFLYFTGVEINSEMLTKITGNISDMLTAGVGIYGFIMFLVSAFKKKTDESKKDTNN